MGRLGRLRGVRGRTTLVATAVVGVALVVGAFVVVQVQRSLLEDDLDAVLQNRADDLAVLVVEAPELETLQVQRQEEAFVQVVGSDGDVVVASANALDLAPVVDPAVVGTRTVSGVPIDEDERFRVLVRPLGDRADAATLLVAVSEETVDETLATLVRTLTWLIPSLVVLVGATTWLMVGRALRPVDAIRVQVEAVTDADLDQRVPEPATGDEIERLARTMNTMLGRLETAFRRQERFVADASHELKSPLTAMRSQLDVDLAHPDTADPDRTTRLVREEVDQLQRLVDDLLYLARADQATSHAVEPIDLDDIVLSEAERAATRTELRIDRSEVSAGQVAGERSSLARLVRNLLDNAVDHAVSVVVVTLEEHEGRVELAVVDDGPGIPAEEAGRVFERFTTLDTARARSDDHGTGLGLAIVRDIARRHGGTVRLDVDHPTGSRFFVVLPALG